MIKIDQASLYLNINRFLFFKDEFLALFDQAFLLKNHWFVEVNLQNQDQIKFIFDPSGSIFIGTKTSHWGDWGQCHPLRAKFRSPVQSSTARCKIQHFTSQKHSKPSMHSYSCHLLPSCTSLSQLQILEVVLLEWFAGVYRSLPIYHGLAQFI